MSAHFPLEFFDELSRSKNLADLLHSTTYWIKQIFESDRVSIALKRDDSSLALYAINGNQAIPLDRDIPIKNTMVGQAYSRKELAVCNNTSKEDYIDCQWLVEGGILSCMDAPLTCNDKCFGTINIGHHDKNHFSARDACVFASLVTWIASQISVHEQVIKMENLANLDPLTGILNRRAFFEATALISRQREAFSRNQILMIIDIDHFKAFNDEFGHLCGDEVLISVVNKLGEVKRKADMFARIGGEEFVLLLEDVTESEAMSLANYYRKVIERMTVDYDNKALGCTISIGLSPTLDSDHSIKQVLARADRALYQAKNWGRNRVCSWQDCQIQIS
ncbi:sensor domain-containing diguanylate cyclase [Vibrio mexicanus]|uniref:sensor domain-containing diguanylate cyclase n=1 Tax=Vibrio mexicanus TaxID=1004326 RepID=UPI00063CDA84|nr:sensor domain-containing diguanylate cyclase [Vibrio mexicanus]